MWSRPHRTTVGTPATSATWPPRGVQASPRSANSNAARYSNPAASTVSLTNRPASISTGSADRDGHLVSADFFDVENHDAITFASTSVERDGAKWTVTGDLTIKGTTRSVTIPFEETGTAIDPFGNTRVGFEGATTINRKDWDLSWNAALETGGVLVSEKIKLEFDISAIHSA